MVVISAGGSVSAWIHNQNGDVGAVMGELNRELKKPSDAEREAEQEPRRDPESQSVRHLRRYSNYLTPKLGFFSSDTWTVVRDTRRSRCFPKRLATPPAITPT